MNHYRIFLGFWLSIIFFTSAEAFYIQQGIHGMKWGSFISEYDELTKVHETGQADYYMNSHMRYQTANQPVPRVAYGFYRDQFYAVFIRLRSPDQFSHLQRQFSNKHGKPKTTYQSTTGQTVYRWEVADVKIKLKIKESIGEYKLAFYYSPLAAKLNRGQLEQIPPEAYGPAPSEEEHTVKSSPLLGY
jgi:hypothetical protein